MARSSTRSTTVAELRRMFSNLDSSVIESVLAANNDQVDVTIDHLLTMSIDTENQSNIQHTSPTPPLRQLPAIPNIYEDDPPPYPGHESNASNHATTMSPLPQRSSSISPRSSTNNDHLSDSTNMQQDLQVRKWKTSYGQYRNCFIGDLPDDFLRVKLSPHSEMHQKQHHHPSTKTSLSGGYNNTAHYSDEEHLSILFQNEEFLNELRQNKDFLNTLHSDQPNRPVQPRRASNQFSSKPLPIPTPPTVETPKTPKIRARMLQNVLTQIEHGQTVKTSMVPEESITQNEDYSYGKDNRERMALPEAPYVQEFDPLRTESNEEFVGRLKNMGKNSMEKFNQLARRFSMRKDPHSNFGKYSKQSMIPSTFD